MRPVQRLGVGDIVLTAGTVAGVADRGATRMLILQLQRGGLVVEAEGIRDRAQGFMGLQQLRRLAL